MPSSNLASPPFKVFPGGTNNTFDDRRKQETSELVLAATIVRRAAFYLINEQVNGRCISVHATHDAIRLLASAGRQIAIKEHRKPALRLLHCWLSRILFELRMS